MSPTAIVAYLALFATVGVLFIFVNLLVGKFVRPDAPNVEKLEVYECGEPTIGSSFVQFDLRFYVIALLFIIFDVEIAFFFPWAVVFGKSTQMMDPHFDPVAVVETVDGTERVALVPAAANVYASLGVPATAIPLTADIDESREQIRESSRLLAQISIGDILVFFAVLMVGFAYVWKRGDLDWVRAVGQPTPVMTGRVVDYTEEELASV